MGGDVDTDDDDDDGGAGERTRTQQAHEVRSCMDPAQPFAVRDVGAESGRECGCVQLAMSITS